jgi:lysophospholipase L1-like esterase
MKSELCRLGCFCAGIPGDSIQNVLYRLGDTLQLLSAMPDELRGVVLLIGTNNIERFSAEAVCDGIVAIVESIHAARPTLGVCVFGLLPRGAWRDSPISDAKLSQRILSCNAQVEAAAKAKDLDFIFFDLSEVFAPGGVRVNNFFRRDQLHLTEHGYQALSTTRCFF